MNRRKCVENAIEPIMFSSDFHDVQSGFPEIGIVNTFFDGILFFFFSFFSMENEKDRSIHPSKPTNWTHPFFFPFFPFPPFFPLPFFGMLLQSETKKIQFSLSPRTSHLETQSPFSIEFSRSQSATTSLAIAS